MTRESGPEAALETTPPSTIYSQRTPWVSLSNSLKVTLASSFTSDQLRHLAALKEADTPTLRARRNLDQASVEELAEMLCASRYPTIGWWRRHTPSAVEMAVAG